jgi:hypothetical protein
VSFCAEYIHSKPWQRHQVAQKEQMQMKPCHCRIIYLSMFFCSLGRDRCQLYWVQWWRAREYSNDTRRSTVVFSICFMQKNELSGNVQEPAWLEYSGEGWKGTDLSPSRVHDCFSKFSASFDLSGKVQVSATSTSWPPRGIHECFFLMFFVHCKETCASRVEYSWECCTSIA